MWQYIQIEVDWVSHQMQPQERTAMGYLGESSKCGHYYHHLRWQGASSDPPLALALLPGDLPVFVAHRLQGTAQEVNQQLHVSPNTSTHLGLDYDPVLASSEQPI